jgi:hypothetical protein
MSVHGRWVSLVCAVATYGALSSGAAASEFQEFGIQSVDAVASSVAAGAHPDFTTELVLNHHEDESGRKIARARAEDVSVELPPGLIGNPNVVLECDTGSFMVMANCPIDSQVGVVEILLSGGSTKAVEPLYNLSPPHPSDEVARLGFFAGLYPVFIDISLRTASDYGITATVHDASGQAPLVMARTILWGVPADPSHDELRLTASEALMCQTACNAPGGKRSSGLPERPFLTNPTACQGMRVDFTVTSYQLPGQTFFGRAPTDPIVDCGRVPFDPTLEVEPTSQVAGAATGLRTSLHIPQVQDVTQPASSAMRAAKVTLPEGMAISASAANGLVGCSIEEVGLGGDNAAGCPDASKLGTATIISPSLPEALHGFIYQRTPEPGHLFRLWLTTDQFGLHIKLPGEIQADPQTGRVTAEFRDLPQLPVEEIVLDFWGGDAAPLMNPEDCGTHATRYELTPWSGNSSTVGQSQMTIDQNCSRSFDPRLRVGTVNPKAGAFSPLLVDISKRDGDENLGSFELTLPKGLLAKLAGVPLCGDAEAAASNCPASSQIGSITAAVGPGPAPLVLPQPGKASTAVFLGGPYNDAPFSVITRVPAQAGPFDLGVVTVRSGLYVDKETAKATIKTDSLPQYLEGVGVIYRALAVVVDRPEFVLNPTDCSELATTSTISSAHGKKATPINRFQVDGCRRLRFSPGLSLRLRGGTKRGDYPALSATLKTKYGQANVRRAVVALPHSAFLAQEHIVTICTRVRFAAGKCPQGSVYGRAKAWTPLLDRPLKGPVFLRSSSNNLPDLVAALRGPIDIDLVGRIDSANGGIRTTFASVPDAPVSRFVLEMRGGRKGLLANSRDLCRTRSKAIVQLDGQNGRSHNFKTPLRVKCGISNRR